MFNYQGNGDLAYPAMGLHSRACIPAMQSADFLLGRPQSFNVTTTIIDNGTTNSFSLSYKTTTSSRESYTDLGLRYDLQTPWTEKRDGFASTYRAGQQSTAFQPHLPALWSRETKEFNRVFIAPGNWASNRASGLPGMSRVTAQLPCGLPGGSITAVDRRGSRGNRDQQRALPGQVQRDTAQHRESLGKPTRPIALRPEEPELRSLPGNNPIVPRPQLPAGGYSTNQSQCSASIWARHLRGSCVRGGCVAPPL